MRESSIQRDIRLHIGSKPDCRVWRNNVGTWQDDHGNWIEYGLVVGSSDLIGIITLPSGLGRFFALEIKRPGAYTKPERREQQRLFRELVNKAGGFAAEVRSVAEAEAAYQEARRGG